MVIQACEPVPGKCFVQNVILDQTDFEAMNCPAWRIPVFVYSFQVIHLHFSDSIGKCDFEPLERNAIPFCLTPNGTAYSWVRMKGRSQQYPHTGPRNDHTTGDGMS